MQNRTHLIFSTLAMLIGMTLNVSFAAAEGVTKDIKSAKAGTYKADPHHTQIVFTLNHLGFTNFTGTFSEASGSLELDPKNITNSKLQIIIPTSSALTHVSKLNEELKSADWFDSAKFPEATFTVTKITPTGNNTANLIGELTLHGTTKSINLKAHFLGAGVNPINKAYTVGFEATGAIKRSDFGVNKYVPLVGDDVNLTIAGAFELEE